MVRMGSSVELSANGETVDPVLYDAQLVAMAAGLTQLRILNDHPEYFPALEEKAKTMAEAMRASAAKHGAALTVNQCGGLLCPYFTDRPVRSFADTKTSDLDKFKRYFNKMLARGLYIAPSQFEATFVNVSHGEAEVQAFCAAADAALAEL